ncbi:MAG: ATP-binding cassette domain-containing protein [Steroidobacterales bacterium]
MLIRLDKVSLAYGAKPLLEQVSLQVDAGERVCVVGRNGEGKSSLLRLVRRESAPDEGTVWIRPGARVAHLAQDIASIGDDTVGELVTAGMPEVARALAEYHALSLQPSSSQLAARLDRLHRELDAANGWQLEQHVATVLSRLGLDAQAHFDQLSGGWRRRVLLARALVSDPDVLLLDEPTNHLDIEAIEWLEETMLEFRGALLFVSHDRAFVNRLATRVIELDRGALMSSTGNYDDYARTKEQLLQIEGQRNALFDKKLAQEEVWIRKGVEARRTRNEGRVRALYALRAARRQRRERTGRIELARQETDESGQLVFEAENISVRFGHEPIIADSSARIIRGDRIGIVGPNGAGKTTLIKLLLGEIEPSSGRIRHGSRLELAYYDQQREQLALDESVMENVSGRNDQVIVNGQSRHVSGYLRDFLFRPDQLKTPARALSGGERNRLLLARLFARPANLLVLDEPTNDLDIDTLELLEEFVSEFPGTLLLVSHDRTFLDHVVTSLLVFEGNGRVTDFVGGYSDWARYRQGRREPGRAPLKSATAVPTARRPGADAKPRKLSYKDQRELQGLPDKLQALEAEKEQLQTRINDPALYAPVGAAKTEVTAYLQRLETLAREIEAGYARWAALEASAG